MKGRTAIFQTNSTLFAKTLMVETFGVKQTRKLTQHEALDALWPVSVVRFKSSIKRERNNAIRPRTPADQHLLSKICELRPNSRRQSVI